MAVEHPDPIPHAATWVTYRQAFRMFLRGVTIRSAARIAVVVGTWLSLLNQGGPIFRGHPPWLKLVLNYATPFTVASLGYLAARRRRNIEATRPKSGYRYPMMGCHRNTSQMWGQGATARSMPSNGRAAPPGSDARGVALSHLVGHVEDFGIPDAPLQA